MPAPPGAAPEGQLQSMAVPQHAQQAEANGGMLEQRNSNIPLRQRYKVQGQLDPPAACMEASGASAGSAELEAPAVVTRMMYMTAAEMKWTMSFLRCAEVIAVVLLALMFVAKLRDKDHWLLTSRQLSFANIALMLLMLLLLLCLFAAFAVHGCQATRRGRAMPQRQRRLVAILTVEALAQIANLSLVVAADVYLLCRPCRIATPFGLSFGNWTCWNTLFLILTVRAHNLNMWQDSSGVPRGDRTDATLLDAPWSVHAPKLILWTAVEVMKAVQVAVALKTEDLIRIATSDCNAWIDGCRRDATYTGLSGAILAVFLAYFGLFFFYLGRAFQQLCAHNYRDYRVPNQNARIMLRTRVVSIVIFAAGFVIFYFVNIRSCSFWTASASSYLPLHLVMTAKIAVLLYLYTPSNNRGRDHVLQEWLEHFSWTEADKPGRLAQRARQLPLDSAARKAMEREPMFCFETAIKLYYFSHMIYYYEKLDGVLPECAACGRNAVEHVGLNRECLSQTLDHLRPRPSSVSKPNNLAEPAPVRAPDPTAFVTHLSGAIGDQTVCQECHSELRPASRNSGGGAGSCAAAAAKLDSLDFALGLYRLEDLEMMWERRWDTVALVGWGPGRVVVVFRGTTTLKNVFADLQAWQSAHPPKRGTPLLGRPAVHNGFLKSYVANGFNERIVEKVVDAIRSNDWPSTQVLVTGHSLGGALANLAAYDIAKALEKLDRKTAVACYTFGAPRVGNYAFAHDYRATVPDTWSVINDQDAVARNAKFWLLYKRPGQRVLINDQGDMLVRPSYAELSMQQSPWKTSLTQHYLLSYRDSLAAVCAAQMNRKKRVQGGLAGVMVLLEGDEFVRGILEPAGLTLADIHSHRSLMSVKSLLQERPLTADHHIPSQLSSAARPLRRIVELPVSPFHEIQQTPSPKLDRSCNAAADAAEEQDQRADTAQPLRPRRPVRPSNDFWWTALPKRVNRRALGEQMTASLAGLPPRPAPLEPGRLSSAFSWLHGEDSTKSSGVHNLSTTGSLLESLGHLFRGHAALPAAAPRPPPAREQVPGALRPAAPPRGERGGDGGKGGVSGEVLREEIAPLPPEQLDAQLDDMEAGLKPKA